MKKLSIYFLILLSIIFFTACNQPPDTTNVTISLGKSLGHSRAVGSQEVVPVPVPDNVKSITLIVLNENKEELYRESVNKRNGGFEISVDLENGTKTFIVCAYYKRGGRGGIRYEGKTTKSLNGGAISIYINMKKISFPELSNGGGGIWKYRRMITVKGSIGAESNYQIRVEVRAGNSGGNVRLRGKSMEGAIGDAIVIFEDVRFTGGDGVTELDYWIEEQNNNLAIFWVEVADDLGTDQNIFIYYGNSLAVSSSNGDATFKFFDDFSNGADKWEYTTGIDISNGIATATGSVTYPRIETKDFIRSAGESAAASVKLLTINNLIYPGCSGFAMIYNNSKKDGVVSVSRPAPQASAHRWIPHNTTNELTSSGMGSFDSPVETDIFGENIIETVILEPGRISQQLSRNGNMYVDDYWDVNTSNEKKRLMLFHSWTGYIVRADWVFVRKYTRNEPTLGTPGQEETDN